MLRFLGYTVGLIFFWGCATTSPLPCPSCPPPIIITKYDTITQVQHDIGYLFHDTTEPNTIWLEPINGDNYQQFQDAINFVIANPSFKIKVAVGHYTYSKKLLAVNFTGKDFNQVTFQMIGPANAKSAPDNAIAIFDGPGLIVQKGKGVSIENIYFKGAQDFTHMSLLQLQYSQFSDWGSYNRYAPIAGVSIDPFTDSANILVNGRYAGLEKYYPGGMSRAGSTGISITGCKFTGWEVALMLSSTYQQNADVFTIWHNQMSFNKVAIAVGQEQAKANSVKDLMVWGNTYTVFDCSNYGRGKGVLPDIDGVNIAGGCYQLVNSNGSDFQGYVMNLYAELIFKIGTMGGYETTTFNHCSINLITDGPVPDFIVKGNINFKDTHLRYYTDGSNKRRLLLNAFCGSFEDGDFDTYPIISSVNNSGVGYCTPKFYHVGLAQVEGSPWNRPLLDTSYHEHAQYIGNFLVTVDSVNWVATTIANIPLNAYVITEDQVNGSMQVGKFNGTNLSEVGVNMRTGNYNLYLVK